MAVEIRVPPLGESIVEATVGRWLKREGERVAAGEPVLELETEKVSLEVAAPQAGVLERITRHAGETVKVGEVLGVLAEEAGAAAPARPEPVVEAAAAPPSSVAPSPEGVAPPSAPSARRLAAEAGIDLARVPGTGPGGRITAEDVRAALAQAAPEIAQLAPSPVPPPPAVEQQAIAPPRGETRREERVRMSRRRLTIARRLVEAQRTAAMLTTFNEIDMSAVMELRRRRRDAFRERHGVSLGLMSFFTKAIVGALKAFPQLNAEIQGEELVLKYYYDIGIAVATDQGLVVPVVRDADRKSFAEIEREIEDLATRARENRLTLQDLQGGTFTITNGGVFGSLLSTPILNYPQVGILGMHRIQERPVVVNGEIVIRPMMYVALSYDHRVVDGREAVLFLVRVKELIEDPELLLLEG
jgi:2-oxoglutarate dehydrogenase E2 component (dihydrolipoamide succinyltransferase)